MLEPKNVRSARKRKADNEWRMIEACLDFGILARVLLILDFWAYNYKIIEKKRENNLNRCPP